MKNTPKALATAFVLSSIASGALAETTVQSCDREVTFDTPPQAAISNDVNLTEMMLVLGLADRMVGYTGISGWNKLDAEMRAGVDQLPELSARYPSKEVLIGADADFYFAGWNYGMRVGGEVTPETLAPFGIDVYELSESCIHLGMDQDVTMDLMYNDLRNLGQIFGVEERAEELISGYEAELAEITAGLDAAADPVRAFVFDSGADAPFTAGHYAIPTAMIEAAGGVNVMDGFRKSWGVVSWEEVVDQDPEVVVIINYGELTAEDRMNIMRDNPALANIDAVRNDRFVVLEYVEATPGPRNIEAIRTLAAAFQGE
ncbi:ABC transporter substrate-binding protein [Cochlodiniinecator piscidefendens]|uniref:ABC transporter substrate-binding protein n=1 Tax=Cochlodiniinecator piscidefendens TaxID=2715756 RepID=UPI00140A2E07|nr:ABC transporter substrate-binding protein [Cochlodiniinecator piscidefendens]